MAKKKDSAGTADDGTAAKKKSKKKMIIGGVVILGAAWKLGVLPVGGGAPADATAVTVTTMAPEGDLLEMESMTVNLADTDVVHYARIGVAAVLREGTDRTLLEPRIGLIQDAVLFEVRTWTAEELMAPGGLEELRSRLSDEIVRRFAEPADMADTATSATAMAGTDPSAPSMTPTVAPVEPGDVLRVVVTEFVVQ